VVHEAVPRERRPEEAAEGLGAQGVEGEEGERRVFGDPPTGPPEEEGGGPGDLPGSPGLDQEAGHEGEGDREGEGDPQLAQGSEEEPDPDPQAGGREEGRHGEVQGVLRRPFPEEEERQEVPPHG
jgi:hypothetical protein